METPFNPLIPSLNPVNSPLVKQTLETRDLNIDVRADEVAQATLPSLNVGTGNDVSFEITDITDLDSAEKTDKVGKQKINDPDNLEFTITSDKKADSASVKSLEQIKDFIQNPKDANQSIQSLLSQVAQDLQKLYPGKKVSIEADLVKSNDQYQPKTFTLPPKNDVTYYKTDVVYGIKVEGEEDATQSIKREIFTNATVASQAMLTAAKYKETVVQLAVASYDKDYAAQGWGIEGFPSNPAEKEKVMKQASFLFSFSYDEAGKPIQLLNIYAGSKKEINLKLNPDPSLSSYEYQLDLDSNKITRIQKRSSPTPGDDKQHIYYQTEDEVLMQAGYNPAEQLYDRLEVSSQAVEDQIRDLKEEIKEKEQKLADSRAFFYKEPLTKIFGAKSTIKPEIETYLHDQQALADLSSSSNVAISSKLSKYLSLQEKLEDYISHLETLRQLPSTQNLSENEKKLLNGLAALYYSKEKINPTALPNIDDLIRIVEDKKAKAESKIDLYKDELDQEKEIFDENLSSFENLNSELEKNAEKLKAAFVKASENPQSKKAQAFLKAFKAKEIERLEAVIKDNKSLSAALHNQLKPTPIQSKEIDSESDETDEIELDEINNS